MCGEPLTEKEKALEGVGGSYVRCDKCVREIQRGCVALGENAEYSEIPQIADNVYASSPAMGAGGFEPPNRESSDGCRRGRIPEANA